VCDAFAEREIRVITHAHSDHMEGLEKSLSFSKHLIMTQITKELVQVLKKRELPSEKVKVLDYEVPFETKEGKIVLYKAGHIPGSCEVLLEKRNGLRILYTGDFKPPEAKIVKCDILITEATYGNPKNVRWFKDRIDEILLELIESKLRDGPVHLYAYHGKMQEVLSILSKLKTKAPVILEKKAFKMANILRKYGYDFPHYVEESSEESFRILREGANYIALFHMMSKRKKKEKATKIILSGWMFDRPVKESNEREYTVALSDHADFEDLLLFVQNVSPRLVITDGYRIGDARALAVCIKEFLGIEAFSMPK